MKLRRRVAIVTGGSRGIGLAVSEALAREGAVVHVVARDREEIRQAQENIFEATGQRVKGAACDVADAEKLHRVIRAIGKKHRRIDILVNCAGIQAPIGSFATNKLSEWERNISVNLLGTIYACKAVLPFMMKRRSGSIINFAGGGATGTRPNFTAYATAKTGIARFTQILADELAPSRVRVNAVSPGGVNTTMLAEVLAAGTRAGKAELAASKKRFKEGGVPSEVPAALVVFLASSDSAGLTGRLVSAPWDAWHTWNKKTIASIMKKNALILERKLLS